MSSRLVINFQQSFWVSLCGCGSSRCYLGLTTCSPACLGHSAPPAQGGRWVFQDRRETRQRGKEKDFKMTEKTEEEHTRVPCCPLPPSRAVSALLPPRVFPPSGKTRGRFFSASSPRGGMSFLDRLFRSQCLPSSGKITSGHPSCL